MANVLNIERAPGWKFMEAFLMLLSQKGLAQGGGRRLTFHGTLCTSGILYHVCGLSSLQQLHPQWLHFQGSSCSVVPGRTQVWGTPQDGLRLTSVLSYDPRLLPCHGLSSAPSSVLVLPPPHPSGGSLSCLPSQMWFSWKYKLMGYFTSFSSSLYKFKPCSSFAFSSITRNSVNEVRIKHCLDVYPKFGNRMLSTFGK